MRRIRIMMSHPARLRRRIARRAALALLLACAPVALAADYAMRQGDTLWELAQQRYGDPGYWKALKWYNGIQNVYTIPVGTPINFPDRAALDRVNQALNDAALSSADRAAAVAAAGGSASRGSPRRWTSTSSADRAGCSWAAAR
jgi:LysM repeat protein